MTSTPNSHGDIIVHADRTADAEMSNIVGPGVTVTLSYQGDQNRSFATTYGGTLYWFPTVGASKVPMTLSFAAKELKEGQHVKIVTYDRRVGLQNVLGAFSDSRECYYHLDSQNDKQLWQVTALESRPDKTIHYGDKVMFTNLSFANQQLTTRGEWVTTAVGGTELYWVITRA